MRIVPVVHLAGAVVLMVLPVPMAVAQAAVAMVQNSVVLLGTELLILVEAEAVVLITPILPATVPRAEAAARASSVCAYTKNKHGLRFGGRERRFIWQLQAER